MTFGSAGEWVQKMSSGRTGTEDVEWENRYRKRRLGDYFEGMMIDVFINIEAMVDVQCLSVIDFSGNLGGRRKLREQVGSADDTIQVYYTHTSIGVAADLVVFGLDHPQSCGVVRLSIN